MRDDFLLYLRLLKWAKPHLRWVFVVLASIVISAALEPLLPALMKPLIDDSFIKKDVQSIVSIPLYLALVFVTKGLADFSSQYAGAILAQRTISDLRRAVFDRSLKVSMPEVDAEGSGRIVSRLTFEINALADAISTVWMTLVRDLLVIVGLLFLLVMTSLQLTLLVFVSAPLLIFAIRVINRRIRKSSGAIQDAMGRLSAHIGEAIAAIKDIKIFGGENAQSQLFEKVDRVLLAETLTAARAQALNVPLVQVLAALTVSTVVFFAASLSRSDALTPGEFVTFITAMSMIFEPIRRLSNTFSSLQRSLASASSVLGWLDRAEEFQGGHSEGGPVDPADVGALTPNNQPAPAISFQDVTFTYPGASQSALHGFNLVIGAGETVALVGPSGSGKSTILNLICGFYPPQSGKILVSGVLVSRANLLQVRKNISLVGQKINLFNTSILENVTMGTEACTDSQVIGALKAANAWEFVKSLPDGIHHVVGHFGESLSGGQRQRLLLARAILKKSPILLLDEATSALDRESEELVFDALSKIGRERTVIHISHSHERLINVDRFVYLNEDKLPPSGSQGTL